MKTVALTESATTTSALILACMETFAVIMLSALLMTIQLFVAVKNDSKVTHLLAAPRLTIVQEPYVIVLQFVKIKLAVMSVYVQKDEALEVLMVNLAVVVLMSVPMEILTVFQRRFASLIKVVY